MSTEKKSILFVCLGNICRSPACEGYVRKHYGSMLDVDSAGLEDCNVGQHPDPRSIKECSKHGINIETHIGRKIKKNDWNKFDLIVALDQSVLSTLQQKKPRVCKAKLVLFMKGVPDPWYGENSAFQKMYSQIEREMPIFMREQNILPSHDDSVVHL